MSHLNSAKIYFTFVYAKTNVISMCLLLKMGQTLMISFNLSEL